MGDLMLEMGYIGDCMNKSKSNGVNGCKDGVAVFWDKDKFKQIGKSFKILLGPPNKEKQPYIEVCLKNRITGTRFRVASAHMKSSGGDSFHTNQLATIRKNNTTLAQWSGPLFLGIDANGEPSQGTVEPIIVPSRKSGGSMSVFPALTGFHMPSTWQFRKT